MCSAIPVFPAEIFDLIIDFCPADTNELTSILRSCCLASKYFVSLCRAHLFREIEIQFNDNLSLTRSRLIKVLERDPRVGLYVKSARYIFNSEDEGKIIARGAEEISDHHLRVDDDRHPTSLHNLLPNVHTLWLEHLYRHPSSYKDFEDSCSCYSADECATYYRTVLHDFAGSQHRISSLTIIRLEIETEDIFILPYLRRLSSWSCHWPYAFTISREPRTDHLRRPFPLEDLYLYTSFRFPLKLFNCFPNLVRIEESVYVSTDNSNPTPYSTPLTLSSTSMLQTVLLSNVSHLRELLSHIPASTPLPSLSQLKIKNLKILEDIEYILTILNRSPNLQRLELCSIPTFIDDDTPPWPLDKCIVACKTSLEHLRLTNQYSKASLWSDIIPLMSGALSAVRGDNHLRSVQLEVSIWPDDLEEWMNTTAELWTTLDEILAVGSDFPDLETIKISVRYSDLNDRPTEKKILQENTMMTRFWRFRFKQLKRLWEVSHTQKPSCCNLAFTLKPRL